MSQIICEDEKTPTREDMQNQAGTHNPIFLFQKGDLRIHADCPAPVEYDHDLECIVFCPDRVQLSNDKIIDEGWGWIEWITEHVWYSREEAEKWGNDHAYRYRQYNGEDGRNGKEWQVYCLPCCGKLADILKHSQI